MNDRTASGWSFQYVGVKLRLVWDFVTDVASILLVCFEMFLVYMTCASEGFMTLRDFFIVATIASAVNVVVALIKTRTFLLLLLVPFATIVLLIPFWHNTNSGRLNYWTKLGHLHNGMTVAQVRETLAPHLLIRGQSVHDHATREKIEQAQHSIAPDFTGTLVCRPLNPMYNHASSDGAAITFRGGHVTNITTYQFD